MTAENLNTKPAITPADVTGLYQFKQELWLANAAGYPSVAGKYSLDVGDTPSKKDVLRAYLESRFPISKSKLEHHEKLDMQVSKLVDHFARYGSQLGLLVFGSYARGVINGVFSDLDFIIVGSENVNDAEALANLSEAGIMVSEELSPVSDLLPIFESGRGLGRIYAMNSDGIEIEFHVLGKKDALQVHSITPGYIKRIREVPPKLEKRSTYDGHFEYVPKPADRVYHRFSEQGRVYRGFFPDVLTLGINVYDPSGTLAEVQELAWRENVKYFLYQNKCFQKLGHRKVDIVLPENAFDSFIQTYYTHEELVLTPERYKQLRDFFYTTVNLIASRYGMQMIISN